MAPIRVLRIIARMNVGGPALQVVNLQRGLDPARFESRLLIGAVGPSEGDYLALRAPDVEATRIEGLGRAPHPLSDIQAFRHVVTEIRRFRPDIVHTHTAKAGVIGRVAALAASHAARVHTFHGHVLHGYFGTRATQAIVLLERMLARRTTRLVAVGSQVRDELVEAGVGRLEQYVVVPPGISLPQAPALDECRRRLGLPVEGFVLGYVGRLTAIKRPDRLVELSAELLRRGLPVTLAVAGDGELSREVTATAAQHAVPLVMLGWRADVETVYGASDVVVLTSDNEGMPVSLIEAAMAGRPAVTTDVGSAREVVEDGATGLLAGQDPGDIASAVERLLRDESLRRSMGARAAERAVSLFGVQRLVDDTAALYEALVS